MWAKKEFLGQCFPNLVFLVLNKIVPSRKKTFLLYLSINFLFFFSNFSLKLVTTFFSGFFILSPKQSCVLSPKLLFLLSKLLFLLSKLLFLLSKLLFLLSKLQFLLSKLLFLLFKLLFLLFKLLFLLSKLLFLLYFLLYSIVPRSLDNCPSSKTPHHILTQHPVEPQATDLCKCFGLYI